jgi:hypothetical protein
MGVWWNSFWVGNMDVQMKPAPVPAGAAPLSQEDVLILLAKLAEHAEAKPEKFAQLLAELRGFHEDGRGRNVQALHQRIDDRVFRPALAALIGRDGLDNTPGLWASRLLLELAKLLPQLNAAEVRRLERLLFEPLSGKGTWDA